MENSSDKVDQTMHATRVIGFEQCPVDEPKEFFLCFHLASLASGIDLNNSELTRMATALSDQNRLFLHSLVMLTTRAQEEEQRPPSAPNRETLEQLASAFEKGELSDLLGEYVLGRLFDDMRACPMTRKRVRRELDQTGDWTDGVKLSHPFIINLIGVMDGTRKACECDVCPPLARQAKKGHFGDVLWEVRLSQGRVFDSADVKNAIRNCAVMARRLISGSSG